MRLDQVGHRWPFSAVPVLFFVCRVAAHSIQEKVHVRVCFLTPPFSEKFVMPLGLFRALIAYTNLDYGMLNAMSLLYMLPSLLIFVFARQYLIKGTMAGAMAGQ